ncbi:RpiR family transcriptional regulator [Levilactobacillus bambusae]|uniref:RpiR family transcriptional regulator n=2 Tax=Levilactobacillus bambusae TaxID=2024736 RepID=A0A2V1N1F7_9LACO|nr:RpiR family transcriptional regulator [Levilactobacillus bambusae]
MASSSDAMSPSERKIANLVLARPGDVSNMTIKELAHAASVSTASVSRFSKRVGFASYREFSLALGQLEQENKPQFFNEIQKSDSLSAMTDKIFKQTQDALTATRSGLSENDLARAVLRILRSKRLGFFGLGGSSIAALDGYHKFIQTGRDCVYYPDYDLQLMLASQMTKNDVAIVVSHSGRNKETMTICRELHKHKVTLIGITNSMRSPLAKLCDITFASLAEENDVRSEGMYSQIAQMVIMDTLFTTSALRMGSESDESIRKVHALMEKIRLH